MLPGPTAPRFALKPLFAKHLDAVSYWIWIERPNFVIKKKQQAYVLRTHSPKIVPHKTQSRMKALELIANSMASSHAMDNHCVDTTFLVPSQPR